MTIALRDYLATVGGVVLTDCKALPSGFLFAVAIAAISGFEVSVVASIGVRKDFFAVTALFYAEASF